MAFMMPVMKNDWDIYNSKQRSRRISEGSQGRSRKVSESKSETGSPAGGSLGSPAHRSVPTMVGMARGASAKPPRPTRSLSCSPPAVGAPQTNEKFHTRLVDKLKRTLMRKSRDGSSVEDERTS